MNDKDSKKESTSTTGAAVVAGTSSSAHDSAELAPAIRNVNVFQSLENCQKFIEKDTHQTRITKLRKEGIDYLQETNWMYSNSNNGT